MQDKSGGPAVGSIPSAAAPDSNPFAGRIKELGKRFGVSIGSLT